MSRWYERFEAEPGTREWLLEATKRIEEVNNEFARDVAELMAATDVHMANAAAGKVERELFRMVEAAHMRRLCIDCARQFHTTPLVVQVPRKEEP